VGSVLIFCLIAACAGEPEPGVSGGPGVLAASAQLRDVAGPGTAESFSGRVLAASAGAQQQPLRMARLFGDSTQFARVSGIQVIGGRLLVTDRFMSQHLAVIDRNSGRVLRQFGEHGRGPGEFFDPASALPVAGDPSRLWMYDFQNRRLTRISLEQREPASAMLTRPMDVGASVTAMFRTGDRLVANGLFPDYTLLVMDTLGRPVNRLVADPPFTPRATGHSDGRRMLNRNFMTAAPGSGRFALAYQFRSRVDFFTADGQRYGTVAGPRATRPSFEVRQERFRWKDGNEMAFSGAASTERFVYALFCGCRLGEDAPPSRVQIFTWQGDLVHDLALDRAVMAIAVSPDDRTLYGAVEEPSAGVGEWMLPAPRDTRTAARND
jgi:hypothetical protein